MHTPRNLHPSLQSENSYGGTVYSSCFHCMCLCLTSLPGNGLLLITHRSQDRKNGRIDVCFRHLNNEKPFVISTLWFHLLECKGMFVSASLLFPNETTRTISRACKGTRTVPYSYGNSCAVLAWRHFFFSPPLTAATVCVYRSTSGTSYCGSP